MYWADKITQSKPIKSQKLFEGGEFSVVHLSNAIVENAGDARVKLVGKLGKGDDITLASLTKGSDTAKLDFYINCTQQVTLSVHGGSDKTEVHLSGYFEPNGEDQDDDMFYGEEAEEGEAEGGEEKPGPLLGEDGAGEEGLEEEAPGAVFAGEGFGDFGFHGVPLSC